MTGYIPEEIAGLILETLPVDVTFIDEDDVIRYYSTHRIFNRASKILGTTVQNCHSPASRAAVDNVIADLRSGRESMIEQMSKKDGRAVLVRYLAVRGKSGEYRGLVEICQWLKGEKEKGA